MKLALRTGHRARFVMAHEEGDVLTEDLAQVGRHDNGGDRAEGKTLSRVHQLFFVAQVELGLLQAQPLGGFLLGILFRQVPFHPGFDALFCAALDHPGDRRTQLTQLVFVDKLFAGRAHNGEASGRQGENEVGTGGVVVVRGVGAAEGVTQNEQDTRGADIDDGVEHRTTRLNDAAGFLLSAGKEAGGVLHENQGDVVDIAEADEAGDLEGRIAVDLTRGDCRVVGDKADNVTAKASEGGDRLAGALRLQLEVIAVIADLLNDNRNVEGGVEPGRRVEGLFQQGVDLPGLALQRIAGRQEGGTDAVVVRQVAKQMQGTT